jgi:hypothetical protein
MQGEDVCDRATDVLLGERVIALGQDALVQGVL